MDLTTLSTEIERKLTCKCSVCQIADSSDFEMLKTLIFGVIDSYIPRNDSFRLVGDIPLHAQLNDKYRIVKRCPTCGDDVLVVVGKSAQCVQAQSGQCNYSNI